jgi:hypothetical protein
MTASHGKLNLIAVLHFPLGSRHTQSPDRDRGRGSPLPATELLL